MATTESVPKTSNHQRLNGEIDNYSVFDHFVLVFLLEIYRNDVPLNST